MQPRRYLHTKVPYTSRSLRSIFFIILSSLTLVYLATLTKDYYWDGITFALQIEKVSTMERGVAVLFHQNHLIYTAVGYLLHVMVGAFGIPARALCVLQITNAFAAAVAVGIFFYTAERLTRSRYIATISSMVLAFSAVWWKLATDADAYILSILLMLICASMLLSDRPSYVPSGFSLAGAMLVHQLASLFYPAAIVAVLTNKSIERKWRFAAKFSALTWATTIAAYYISAVLLHEIREPLAVVKWAVSNQSGVTPSANPIPGLRLLLRGNLDMVIGHSFTLFWKQDGRIEKLIALAALVTAICFVAMFVRRVSTSSFRGLVMAAPQRRELWRAYAPMLSTWVIAYMIFLIFWEPWQVLYRVFYLPPLALALGLALSIYNKSPNTSSKGTAALAIATLILWNLSFYIAPHMRRASNPLVVTARETKHRWNENTVIYFSDHNEADTFFEYFNSQTEWRRLNAAARMGLESEITQVVLNRGGQVWLNKGAAESVDSNWLGKHATGSEIIVESPNAPAHYVELNLDPQ